jgi:HlyD family secretion protein
MSTQPDLLVLSRGSENAAGVTSVTPPARRWLLRFGLPAAVMVAVVALLLYTARDALVSATDVWVAPVVVRGGGGGGSTPGSAAQQVLVQAPGWVEADPYAVSVPALTPGVVREVLVLEGQRVEKGQVVAVLVDDDAKLAQKRSRAELEVMEAELEAARANHGAAVSRVDELRDEVERKRGLVAAGGVSEGQFARLGLRLKALEQEVEGAQAAVTAAEARVRQREVACDEADLALERTQVRAAAAGVVLARLVEPGARISMEGAMPGAVVRLYDPSKLQVRVDVPIADAAKVGVGTPAAVVTEALPDRTFTGVVTRLVHEADIQRNTVQVKVALESPDATLKPEMLTRVRFMGAGGAGAAGAGGAGDQVRRFLIPATAVLHAGSGQAAGQAHVFVVDHTEQGGPVAAMRSVTLSPAQDGYMEAVGDLREGDRVIVEPTNLREGQRVRIAGEKGGGDAPH